MRQMTFTPVQALALLDHLNTAVLVFDPALRLAAMNSAGEDLLSVSARQVCGQALEQFLPGAEGLTDTINLALDNHQPYTEWGLELNLLNQKFVAVDCMVTPVFVNDRCSEIIVELVNVHSFNRAQREANLLVLHEAAKKSLRGVAHEIKNPLGGLRGAAQLLEQELPAGELTEYTQIIISEADRLSGLIDQMLLPDRQQQRRALNVHEILEYVINLVTPELAATVVVAKDYDPSLPMLRGDRDQLVQAFLNVVQNAIQCIDGSGQVLVRTRIKRNCTIRQQQFKHVVVVEVIDDGPGVAEEIQSEIFYPMVTTRPEGTGLGLSIAQSIVHTHKGTIEHERQDERTIFRMLLPVTG